MLAELKSKTIKITKEQYERLFEDAKVIGLNPDRWSVSKNLIRGRKLPNGDWRFAGKFAFLALKAGIGNDFKDKCQYTNENGLPVLIVPANMTNSMCVPKGYKMEIRDYDEGKGVVTDNPVLGPSDEDKRLQDHIDAVDVNQHIIASQEDYIKKLRKMIPKEATLYKKWQETIGTPEEAKYRDNYDIYYRRHEDVILALQRAEDDLEKMRKQS